MTREEFESILEEAYIEGYNTALEDIQEDILDEEAYDLEGEYNYFVENDNIPTSVEKTIKEYNSEMKKNGINDNDRSNYTRLKTAQYATSGRIDKNSNLNKLNNSYKYEKPYSNQIERNKIALNRLKNIRTKYLDKTVGEGKFKNSDMENYHMKKH